MRSAHPHLLVAFLAVSSAQAQATLELGLPDMLGATAVSADGSVIVGWRIPVLAPPFLLSGVVLGPSGLPLTVTHPAGFDITGLNDVTDDGSTFVGLANNASSPTSVRAVRWDGASNPVLLGTSSPPAPSLANGISGDGAFVVGSHDNLAARWDSSGQLQILGTLPGDVGSYAASTNGDGSVIVGASRDAGFCVRAFKWTRVDGMVELLAPAGYPYCRGTHLSDDGAVVVGIASSAISALYVVCVWRDSHVPTVLTEIPVSWTPSLASMSGDGRLIFGTWTTPAGADFPYVWSSGSGYEDLDSYLHRYGLPSGQSLPAAARPQAVSRDGRTVVGDQSLGNSVEDVWRAHDGSRDAIHRVTCGAATPNSTGVPASLSAAGSPFVAANDVTLRAESVPPSALTMFVASQSIGAPTVPMGSVGSICLQGHVSRLNGPDQLSLSGLNGAVELRLDLMGTPAPGGTYAVMAGETWHYQAVYRDRWLGAPTFNFSSAAEVIYR